MIDGVRLEGQPPYPLQCIEKNIEISVALDDMAQIIGGPVKIVADDHLEIFNALKTSSCVMVKGRNPYAIATGRDKREAETAMAVLDKAAEVELLSRAIGGVKPLPSLNIRKQRRKYLNKYSQMERAEALDNGELCELKPRKDLVDYGNKLLEKHLVEGTWGNISVKISAEDMMVTPSGLDYSKCAPQDMVRVDITTGAYPEASNKPTTEVNLHRGIYAARPDVGAVIHTHSKYCSVFAACRMPLDIIDRELQNQLGDLIDVSEYGYAGSTQLTDNVIKALGQRSGCIIANHGMICCGNNLEEAFERTLSMEEAARKFLIERI